LEKIIIETANQKSIVAIGEKWTNAIDYLPAGKGVIITDDNLVRFYGDKFPALPVIRINPGEGSKSLSTVEEISRQLLGLGIDRNGFILGIGGGVVCDLAGFVASIYMRGIRFGFVSTSLLSQIDASVGGKNGVNTGEVKNVIGTFNQPEFVICDPSMLETLPGDEFLSGLAEMIKTGAILDPGLLDEIEVNKEKILERDEKLLSDLIIRSVRLKATVVAEDEKESGKRMILNFGHTFGHVIETETSMKHGFAVASGMVIAAGISVDKGLLERRFYDRLISMLKDFGLLLEYKIPSEMVSLKISGDKKKKGNEINFILIGPPGKATIHKIPVSNLVEYYKSQSAIQ
jgi:3-dehydroquinate synthase